MVDMAHFAGLVAAGLHPSPRAARPRRHLDHPQDARRPARRRHPGANAEPGAKKFNSSVFPGQQGGPLEHVIAAKAVAFKLAAEPAFRERQERTLAGARILADRLLADDCPRGRDRRGQRRHRRAPGAGRPARLARWTASRPRTGCTRSASPSTATRCRSTRGLRWSAPASASAPPRWPPAASPSTSSPRSPTSSPRRCARHLDETSLDALRGRGSRRWPTPSRSTRT